MKKWIFVFLLVTVLFTCCGCQSQPSDLPSEAVSAETRLFTDSLGREVAVPASIEKVAMTGPMAQIVLFALCPDYLVGIANSWNEGSELFLKEEYFNLPVLG